MAKANPESGNVLFLILIAVVLFAALTFAVTMSNRGGGGGDINQENLRLAASLITQHSVDLERAVVKLRISGGYSENNISFETPAMPGYVNPSCPGDSCKVFSPAGGQSSYIKPQDEWLNRQFSAQDHYGSWLITGTTCIPGIGNGNDAGCNADPANQEIVAFIPWVTRDLCIEINNRLGLEMTGGEPPQATGSAWGANPEFTGSFGAGEALIDAGNTLFAKPEGCFQGNGTPPAGSYHYYRVLFPR